VAAVKVRSGVNDPKAQRPYLLWADMDKCTFYDDNPNTTWTPSGWAED